MRSTLQVFPVRRLAASSRRKNSRASFGKMVNKLDAASRKLALARGRR